MTKNYELQTTSYRQTQKIGRLLSQEIESARVVCLEGDLGAGKTTFAQGLLRGLGAKGPYISPTFMIMKEYGIKREAQSAKRKIKNQKSKLSSIYHIDAYRVGAKDILELGWKEMINDPGNVIIVEWADRIRKIIPGDALWIRFQWIDDDKRRIILSSK